ncbi:unnamed protein product [Toxocara canis]|uniref:Plexin-B n=1 Tax=Toxocara canis TaxID=6265 RepID=A0A3P7G5Q1_TOXCA|nr:unnamed protein product [Toxocara canis]
MAHWHPRPYFTYWVTCVQVLVSIITIFTYGFGPIGFGRVERTADVLHSIVTLKHVNVYELENLWLGPKFSDLVHLGETFAPCMRHDPRIYAQIEADRALENETGCCVYNDGTGCFQTGEDTCPKFISSSAIAYQHSLLFTVKTTLQILKLLVSDCGSYSTCNQCIENRDALCGWCLFEGACKLRPLCTSLLTSQCPRPQPPVPSNISVDTSKAYIFLPIGAYPIAQQTQFICTFGEQFSHGEWSDKGVRCFVPNTTWQITDGDRMTVNVSVFKSPDYPPITTQNFILYDCSKHVTCSACSSSQWDCKWCASNETCFPRHADCEGQPASECARISSVANPEILIADGTNVSVSLLVVHISLDSPRERLSCHMDFDGQTKVVVDARLSAGKVLCDPWRFTFHEAKPQKHVKLYLFKDISLIDTTNVTLYKCVEMGSECSICLSLDPKWSCTWCGNVCSHISHCTSPPSSNSADVLCGQPRIESFEPVSGPLEGGTRIEIRGRELGLSLSDVKDRVFVGGSKCDVLEYEVSSKIVCVAGPGSGPSAIQLRLGQSGRRFVDSSALFHFVDPQPKSVYPTFGPVSGGTRITIYGSNLSVGSNTTVLIGEHPCKVLRENELHAAIVCTTSRAERPVVVDSIRIQVDRSIRILQRKFEYRRDPVVRSIFPTSTFESGGRLINVEGENLDSVLAPKMYIASVSHSMQESISTLGDCEVRNGSRMVCLSPRSNLPPNFSPSTYSRWPVGFLMDNVQSVRNLGARIQITVVPDPQFVPLKGVHVHRPDQLFLIEGNHLSHAATADDYQIYIGSSRCVLTLLETRQVMCRAPSEQPAATDEKGNPVEGGRPLLTVIIGSIRHELGLVEYETSAVRSEFCRLSLSKLLALLCAGITVCTIAFVFACVIYRRKKDEREKDYKRIQLKMEYLEFNVRNECKQAFAELQTDVTDLTMAVDGRGIPFHEKTEFISRLLFKEIISISGLLTTSSLYSRYILAFSSPNELWHSAVDLAQFRSLLCNKRFIFAIVEMAECNPTFGSEEKKVLCSLLIGALLSNFSYCSDVVLSLLITHITNSIQVYTKFTLQKGHFCDSRFSKREFQQRTAHLVFRQSSSLVEKLFSLWFSQLLVVPLENFDQSPILVRALTCDTISQLKMKLLDAIYKNEPFSARITIEHFDLEWRCPKRGSLLLSDDDNTTLLKASRKLNCISDYGITNNSLLSMQPKFSHAYANSSAQSTSTGCQTTIGTRTVRYYHLESSPERGSTLNKIDQSIPKSIPEVFLTRLLTSKGTVEKFVDDFFNSVLFTNQSDFPVVLKYVFEMFDEIAVRNNTLLRTNDPAAPLVTRMFFVSYYFICFPFQFTDSIVIRTWKTNAWILRFWVNVISNVDYVLDVQRTVAVDASLAVIAQTLVDACSTTKHRLGKESPSSKLLFAKDIERYRHMVGVFFKRIKSAPNVSAKQFFDHVTSLPNDGNEAVSGRVLTSELLAWVRGNGARLVEILSQDPSLRQHRIADRLQQIIECSVAEPEHIYATLQ